LSSELKNQEELLKGTEGERDEYEAKMKEAV
jgi:hypothetical protein